MCVVRHMEYTHFGEKREFEFVSESAFLHCSRRSGVSCELTGHPSSGKCFGAVYAGTNKPPDLSGGFFVLCCWHLTPPELQELSRE